MRAGAAAVLQGVGGEGVVLEEVRVEASIDDLLAEVTVTQRYRNPEATNIEAVYTFPLPLDGVLLAFEAEIGERRLAGTVVERSEGERRYEDAISEGDAAMLLEQAGPGLYTASVGNLMPGESATIRFRYGLLLSWNGDRVRFTMPTTIAPRYGDPVQAGLALHQSPEYAFDADSSFALRLAVRGLLKDARFSSPSHIVAVTPGSRETVVEIAGTPALDRDFVLEARASRPEAAGALLARDLDGWVALASFRPEIPETEEVQRRGVGIVVDCSGSMAGDSIAQAKAGLERILDGLRADDAFEIIAFGSHHRALFGRERPVSEAALAEARRFVRALDADMGGTEIGEALEAAYRVRGEAGLPRDLLLITDGALWNAAAVVERARRSGHRIFTVGVGSAVAEAFVRGLAEATGGACELVAPREDMAERVHRHFQRMYAPRAERVSVRWPAPPLRTVPDPIASVHGGDTVHLLAWFAEEPEGRVRLDVALADGRAVGQEADILTSEDMAPPVHSSDAVLPGTLARLAAARRLAGMVDETAASELAVRYQLMSAWTTYVVVHERADGEKAADLPAIRKVPQVLAAGWHGMGSVFARQELSVSASRAPDVFFQRVRRPHSAPHRLPDVFEERMHTGRSFALLSSPSTFGPSEFAAALNGWPLPAQPMLHDLEIRGLPDDILTALRELVGRGEDEAAVVAALLHVLAESMAGAKLERHVRRRIRRRSETLRPTRTVIDAVTPIFDRWQARSITENATIEATSSRPASRRFFRIPRLRVGWRGERQR